MINLDNPVNIILIVVIIWAGLFFLGIQYELCVAMPERWFAGFASGMVLVICLAILYHRRE